MGVPTIGPIFTLTQVAASVLPYPGATTGTTVYTGTITGGAATASQPNGAYAGKAFNITGFAALNNNGEFVCVQSSATTLTLNNRYSTAVVAAGQAQISVGYGNPSQYASKVEKLQSSNQGDNVYVSPQAGDTLIAIAFGLKSLDPFDQLHGASPSFGYLQGLNDFMPTAPTISDTSNGGNSPNAVTAELGSASEYAILAYAGITNTGASVVSGGNIGSAPTTGPEAGFTFVPPAAIDNASAGAARTAGNAAFTYYSGLTPTQTGLANLSTNNGGGGVGVYHAGVFSGGTLDIPTSITLDAQGNPNALFVFIAASTVTLESGASIILANGAQAANVVWVVGSSFTSVWNGISSNMVGVILAYTSITLGGGTLNGRALAVGGGDGAVTIASATAITTTAGTGTAIVNNWVLLAHINLADADYSGYSIPPAPNSSWPAADWSLDGYYPSLYIWACYSANAGTYAVNLNSVYQDGVTAPLDLAAGKPVFDGGINFQVIDWTNMTGVSLDGVSVGLSSANPAVAPAFQTTQANDLIIAVGLQKSANGLGAGEGSAINTSGQLGSAGSYSILAGSGITNTGVTVVTGGVVGSSPTTTIVPGAAVWTVDNADAPAAQVAATSAYNYFAGLPATVLSASSANLSTLGNLGASRYSAGVYSAGSSMDIPTSITLDAQGNPNATFVFIAGSTTTLESGASVLLANGAQAGNVIWIVGSSFTQVGDNNTMVGTIIAYTSITLDGGTLNGRALARNGSVTIAAAEAINTANATGAAGMNIISNGKLVGSEAHYLVTYEIGGSPVAGSPPVGTGEVIGFANPLGYETLVAVVALQHS